MYGTVISHPAHMDRPPRLSASDFDPEIPHARAVGHLGLPSSPGYRPPPKSAIDARALADRSEPVAFTTIDRNTNVPDRFELFYTAPGEEKIKIVPETRVPNAAIFQFIKEDHTLGNLLRSRLLQSPHVIFAAYKVPHPLFPNFDLRVQTDGTIAPKDALLEACREIVKDLASLSREFTKEWEIARATSAGRPDLQGL